MLSSFKADLNLREASAYAKLGAYEEVKLLFYRETVVNNLFYIDKFSHFIESHGRKL